VSRWRRPRGKVSNRKPAGQLSLRAYLESGNWGANPRRNTYRNSSDPRFQAATKSHEAALQQLDVLIGVAAAQEHLIDLLVSLGEETQDGLWLP
jgi:hypothetical protein